MMELDQFIVIGHLAAAHPITDGSEMMFFGWV